MSKYTTGELAKLCGVTVRTVQYYDTRGILIPSELSEGGRRLYSDEDLRRMKIICFLRELGLPIASIGQLLSEENPPAVISLLIRQQEQSVREDLEESQRKLDKLTELKRELKSVRNFSVETIGDIAIIMANKKRLKKVHRTILFTGIPVNILEWASIIYWIVTGSCRPFLICLAVIIPYTIWVSRYYHRNTAYICPRCHAVFRPGLKEMFWARHTPGTRKLTCTACGHHGFCVETYGGDRK